MTAHVLMIILSYRAWAACDPRRSAKSRLPFNIVPRAFPLEN